MPRRMLIPLLGCCCLLAAPGALADWSSDPTIGLPVCTSAGDQGLLDILDDGYGGAWIAWMDDRGGAATRDIYVQHILAGGAVDPAWPENGLLVCGASRHQQSPVLATDGAGGVYVAWHDFRLSNGDPDAFVHHVLATGVRDPAWPTWGVQVSPDLGFQYPPDILADGAGGVFVAFGNISANNDVRLHHVLASGVVDPAWTVFGVLLCSAAGDQYERSVASDGGTGVIVGWDDTRAGNQDIYATHVLADGTIDPTWPVNGVAVCSATGTQEGAQLVSDGAGGAIVSWRDLRTDTNGDIYAQRVLSNGAVDGRWPPNGLAVCASTGQQIGARLVSDGAQGAVIMWQDKRGADLDIYAQRVLGDGTFPTGSTPDGSALCTAAGDQTQGVGAHKVLADGSGGAFIAWHDARTGVTTKDSYATHVLPTGGPDPLWPVDGRAVCTAANDQGSPGLAPDGSGGILVAWSDKRDGTDYDIYAQRVLGNGELPTVGVGGRAWSSGVRLEATNPARAAASIRYSLSAAGRTSLHVLDLSGRHVRQLSSGISGAGWNEARWDLLDGAGLPVSNGVYLVRLAWSGGEVARKFAVVR